MLLCGLVVWLCGERRCLNAFVWCGGVALSPTWSVFYFVVVTLKKQKKNKEPGCTSHLMKV